MGNGDGRRVSGCGCGCRGTEQGGLWVRYVSKCMFQLLVRAVKRMESWISSNCAACREKPLTPGSCSPKRHAQIFDAAKTASSLEVREGPPSFTQSTEA